MPIFTYTSTQTVKRSSTFAILQEDMGGRSYGHYFLARCLWHTDQHPSLLVFEKSYRCLSCNRTGPLTELQTEVSEGYQKPMPTFRNPFRAWLQAQSLQNILKSAYQCLQHFPQQGDYLYRRGITPQSIKQLKIGWKANIFTFPIFQEKTLVGCTARYDQASHNHIRYFNPPNQADYLYVPNASQVNNSMTIYCVFGILDAITLTQLGYPVVTGTQGKHINPQLFKDLRKKIVIIPDRKEEADALKLANALDWRGTYYRYPYPPACKDINDVFLQHPEHIQQHLGG